MHRSKTVLLALMIAPLLSVALNFAVVSRREKQMISKVKRMPAAKLDTKLTSEGFERWFTRIVGRGAVIAWKVNDCGEQTGSPADRQRDIPVCVEAEASLPNGTVVVVQIAVGTVKKGLHGPPTLKDAFVERYGQATTLKELSQLPELLR